MVKVGKITNILFNVIEKYYYVPIIILWVMTVLKLFDNWNNIIFVCHDINNTKFTSILLEKQRE